jgi:hypothetical protein
MWYDSGGNAFAWKDEEDFLAFYNVLREAAASLNLDPPTDAMLYEYVQAKELNNSFKEEVTSQLGEDIYDLMAWYYDMNTSERREWRRENPEDYKRIDEYYDLKEYYGSLFPVWQKYYDRNNYDPSVRPGSPKLRPKLQSDSNASSTGGSSPSSSRGRRPRSASTPPEVMRSPEGGVVLAPFAQRSTTDPTQLLARQGLVGTGGGKNWYRSAPMWPQLLLDRAGQVARSQVEKAYDRGIPVDTATRKYLTMIAEEVPEFEDIIQETIEGASLS